MRLGPALVLAAFLPLYAATVAALPLHAAADADAARPLERPAMTAARATQSVLLDAARAGPRLVAVGERGLVMLSDDDGRQWRQAATPTSVTLTAVRFASATRGWATGHAGTVLATDDAGTTWRRQLDGRTAAAAALAEARQASAPRPLADAERLVADGPDKPFLDLWFADERHGFAVGAYNLFLRTDDGGATWAAALGRLPNPKGSHLYAIRGRGALVVIAGEQGLLLRSRDGGASFAALESPYAGSFFTLALLPGGELVAAGLRGNAFRSTDQGESWQPLRGLPPLTWTASSVGPDGTLWLGNQAGQVFLSRDAGQHWQPVPPPPGAPGAPLTGLLALGADSALTTTVRGIGRVSLAAAPAK